MRVPSILHVLSVIPPFCLPHHCMVARACRASTLQPKLQSMAEEGEYQGTVKFKVPTRSKRDFFRKLHAIHNSGLILWAIDTEFITISQSRPVMLSVSIRDMCTNEITVSCCVDYGQIEMSKLEELICKRLNYLASTLIGFYTALNFRRYYYSSRTCRLSIRSISNIIRAKGFNPASTGSSYSIPLRTLVSSVELWMVIALSSARDLLTSY